MAAARQWRHGPHAPGQDAYPDFSRAGDRNAAPSAALTGLWHECNEAGTMRIEVRARRWFIAVWVLLLLVKLAVAARLPLFVDEAFYWQEGQHLAWAYSDLPGADGMDHASRRRGGRQQPAGIARPLPADCGNAAMAGGTHHRARIRTRVQGWIAAGLSRCCCPSPARSACSPSPTRDDLRHAAVHGCRFTAAAAASCDGGAGTGAGPGDRRAQPLPLPRGDRRGFLVLMVLIPQGRAAWRDHAC